MCTTVRLLRSSADAMMANAEYSGRLIEETIAALERLRGDMRGDLATLPDALTQEMWAAVEARIKQVILRLEGP